jgi:hypothetical protein
MPAATPRTLGGPSPDLGLTLDVRFRVSEW